MANYVNKFHFASFKSKISFKIENVSKIEWGEETTQNPISFYPFNQVSSISKINVSILKQNIWNLK